MKIKTIKVLFSVQVDVPLDNPNSEKLGPGPMLFGFLDETMQNALSEAPGNLDAPWAAFIGAFRLEGADERMAKGGKWKRVYRKYCMTCGDGSGCMDCDPCTMNLKGKCLLRHHKHVD